MEGVELLMLSNEGHIVFHSDGGLDVTEEVWEIIGKGRDESYRDGKKAGYEAGLRAAQEAIKKRIDKEINKL